MIKDSIFYFRYPPQLTRYSQYFTYQIFFNYRYSPKGCNHCSGQTCCRLLTMADVNNFHSAFYSSKNKEKQDAFLLKYCGEKQPARRRNEKGGPSRIVTYEYCVLNRADVRVHVCRSVFLNILGITKHRVIGVFQRFKRDGSLIPQETRGGNRKESLYKEKQELVIKFIKGLRAVESHYNRAKSRRIYLSSDLNITKIWKMYNASVSDNVQVKESYFRHIFLTRFN